MLAIRLGGLTKRVIYGKLGQINDYRLTVMYTIRGKLPRRALYISNVIFTTRPSPLLDGFASDHACCTSPPQCLEQARENEQ